MVPQNIKINNVRSLDAKLCNDEYFDFMLYKGEAYGVSSSGECLATYIDFENPDCYTVDGGVQSLVSWENSKNEGVELTHIGMTGVDNGLIDFDKYTIRNKIFYELFFNSKMTINEDDTKFHLNCVDGNTKKYSYDISLDSESGKTYVACKGGFLQGFFKLEGYDYQVLPDYIENDWHFEFVIRPRSDYKTKDNILNNTYPEHAGTFFYIGTRAENKFAELMNRTSAYTDNYSPKFMDYAGKPTNYYEYDDPQYPKGGDVDFFRTKEREIKEEYLHSDFDDRDYYDYYDPYSEKGNDIDYFISKAAEKLESYLNDEEDISLSGVTLSAQTNYMEIETDNKFIFFNRTCTGFTTSNWNPEYGESILLTGYTHQEYKENAFLLFNRTCTGLTTFDVDEYFNSVWDETNDYNIFKDVIGNAFSLQYNDDGSITYNYTMRNCDVEEGWSQESETTLPGLIHKDEWNIINVRFLILNNSYRDCISLDLSGNTIITKVINNLGNRKMKIMIYINGRLVFISKELNEFRFRPLKDIADRQEGVPYNISLGGGTQGLGEKIWIDYLEPVDRHYFIEQTYAGSFIGDIRSFKMYDCMQNYQTIRNNAGEFLVNI